MKHTEMDELAAWLTPPASAGKLKEILLTWEDIRGVLKISKSAMWHRRYSHPTLPHPPTFRAAVQEYERRRKRRPLTPKEKTALLLHKQGLSYGQIARRLGCKNRMVIWRNVRRAIDKLQNYN